MIALIISGMLLLSARVMIEELADGADRITTRAQDADHSANAERQLRELVGRTHSSTIVRNAIAGDATRARIATTCDVPAGWQEDCEATIAVRSQGGQNMLTLSAQGGAVTIRSGFGTGKLLYLADPRSGGSWLSNWTSAITTPVALGVVVDADTLILRIGERG
jgi:hypothetical protein